MLRGKSIVLLLIAVELSVTSLLETHFTILVDYDFSALMEEYLDKNASDEAGRVDWLRDLYFGHDGQPGLNKLALDLGVTHDQSRNVSANLAIIRGVLVHD